MTDKKERLGERIRAARAEKGWKQKHLAAQVNVEPITVSRWERGATSPDLEVISHVAEATGKPLSYFVGEETSRGPWQVRPPWKRRHRGSRRRRYRSRPRPTGLRACSRSYALTSTGLAEIRSMSA